MSIVEIANQIAADCEQMKSRPHPERVSVFPVVLTEDEMMILLNALDTRLDELDQAFLARDAVRIDLLAHQIAGAAGNCSAEALERLSRRISHLAREGRLDEDERLMLPLKLRVTRLAQCSADLATA